MYKKFLNNMIRIVFIMYKIKLEIYTILDIVFKLHLFMKYIQYIIILMLQS